jgi:GNAT superfamily N-acetyltransferase
MRDFSGGAVLKDCKPNLRNGEAKVSVAPEDSASQPYPGRKTLIAFRAKNGKAVNIRLVEPGDREALQRYVCSLSSRTRYNRFLGAVSELPAPELDRLIHPDKNEAGTVVATAIVDGTENVVGEARYAFQADTLSFEFGLSISDGWRGLGIGKALLKCLECRAASFGAERMFGDTLRSNEAIITHSNEYGYSVSRSPGDWRLVRYGKTLLGKQSSA